MMFKTQKTRLKPFLLASLSVATLTFAAQNIAVAQDAAAPEAFSTGQKTQIEAIVKDYLIANPEVIAEAMNALRVKQEQAMNEEAQAKLEKHKEYFNSAEHGVAGNPEGDVTVVEFFDYNCGYCKKAFEDVQALLDKDKNVKVVFIEMPILSPTSLDAAKWALAAKEQGKYFEFHKALMEFQGDKNEAALTDIATKLELDVEKLKTDAASEKVQEAINKGMEVSRDIGIQGTPAFIVGKQLFRGYIGTDALIQSVQEERA